MSASSKRLVYMPRQRPHGCKRFNLSLRWDARCVNSPKPKYVSETLPRRKRSSAECDAQQKQYDFTWMNRGTCQRRTLICAGTSGNSKHGWKKSKRDWRNRRIHAQSRRRTYRLMSFAAEFARADTESWSFARKTRPSSLSRRFSLTDVRISSAAVRYLYNTTFRSQRSSTVIVWHFVLSSSQQ